MGWTLEAEPQMIRLMGQPSRQPDRVLTRSPDSMLLRPTFYKAASSASMVRVLVRTAVEHELELERKRAPGSDLHGERELERKRALENVGAFLIRLQSQLAAVADAAGALMFESARSALDENSRRIDRWLKDGDFFSAIWIAEDVHRFFTCALHDLDGLNSLNSASGGAGLAIELDLPEFYDAELVTEGLTLLFDGLDDIHRGFGGSGLKPLGGTARAGQPEGVEVPQ